MPIGDYQRRIKAEKRDAALEAALDAFLTRGYDGTSLAEIARAAGISTGTLFKRFPTKASLFQAAVERAWDVHFLSGRSPSLPPQPEEGMTALGVEYARVLRSPFTRQLLRIIVAESMRFPDLARSLFERGKSPYMSRLNDYIEQKVRAGALEIEDVPLATRQFLSMINDAVLWRSVLMRLVEIDDGEAARIVAEAAKTFLARYGSKA